MHLSLHWNCWSLRCRWSIACWHCSNYMSILDLTPGFNGLGKDNGKMRWETFNNLRYLSKNEIQIMQVHTITQYKLLAEHLCCFFEQYSILKQIMYTQTHLCIAIYNSVNACLKHYVLRMYKLLMHIYIYINKWLWNTQHSKTGKQEAHSYWTHQYVYIIIQDLYIVEVMNIILN